MLLLLELNEINFEAIEFYAARDQLPTFAAFIARHGIVRTTSEQRYEELEPWIQWVTAHTGRSFAEHGIFRLGDINRHDIPQIWEVLEGQGLKVGAISPMNASNRTCNAAFFVPDPWTSTAITGSFLTRKTYAAIAQAVDDNAEARLNMSSILWLLAGSAANARMSNYAEYLRLAATARHSPWSKAMFLDLLLADVFITKTRTHRPDFASLFLNAGAHIQHHYLFSSEAYADSGRNPDWYVKQRTDPLLDVYRLYDRVLRKVRGTFPKARIMVATALHQDPYPTTTYYWRLKDHAAFLRSLDISFTSVEPRMSRDFLIICADRATAEEVEARLTSAHDENGVAVFEVDNRGETLFVTLTYPHAIERGTAILVGNRRFEDFDRHVAFVAIKNGEHNGIGYLVDTGLEPGQAPANIPLSELPKNICSAFGLPWAPTQSRAGH